jgi:hypothetical protein
VLNWLNRGEKKGVVVATTLVQLQDIQLDEDTIDKTTLRAVQVSAQSFLKFDPALQQEES